MIDIKTAEIIVDAIEAQEGGGKRSDLECIDKAYRKALVRSLMSQTIDPKRDKPEVATTISRRVLVGAIQHSSADDLRPLTTKLNLTVQDCPVKRNLFSCCQVRRKKGREVMLPVAALTVSAIPTIANSV